MFGNLKNRVLGRYRSHSEAVIIACYFNPYNNPYRLRAFEKFYETIQHLNHRVVECVVGDGKFQLPQNKNIARVKTSDVLWHKEALLNGIIAKLPREFKYVFWLDADVLLTNNDWLVDAIAEFKRGAKILQPFEFCVHLDKDEEKPSYSLSSIKREILNNSHMQTGVGRTVWRSFCANVASGSVSAQSTQYDTHGHVGFAWGATRELLNRVPLYDRALIGGADHIIAHAAAGQISHPCIAKSFTEDLQAVNEWSRRFYRETQGAIGYVGGDLYHIWHGDLKSRQYLKRIREFTPQTKQIRHRDVNGLYVTNSRGGDSYVRDYMRQRENPDDFLRSALIGYATDSPILGGLGGGNFLGGLVGSSLRDHADRDVRQYSVPREVDPQENQSPIHAPAVREPERDSTTPIVPFSSPVDSNGDTNNVPDIRETPTEHWDGEQAAHDSTGNGVVSNETCSTENFS
jgi:hypothetical protein